MKRSRKAVARKIIGKIKYITIATVKANGQPWNTPVFTAFDEKFNFYWNSTRYSVHSINIRRNPRVFLVIYNSLAPEGFGEGVYMLARAKELTRKADLGKAFKVYGKRSKPGQVNLSMKEFTGSSPLRFYKATPMKFWINDADRRNGNYVDMRIALKMI